MSTQERVASYNNVDVFQTSHAGIENTVRSSFTSLVHDVLGLQITVFVMAALCNRGAIIFLPCSFFLLLSSFFPRLISAATDWMSTILLHMAWP